MSTSIRMAMAGLLHGCGRGWCLKCCWLASECDHRHTLLAGLKQECAIDDSDDEAHGDELVT
jgi:hypothetical protein